MAFYSELAFRLFSGVSEAVGAFFTDIRVDLRKAQFRTSVQEYLSKAILTTMLAFVVSLPLLSLLFAYFFHEFLFAFITAFTISFAISGITFFSFMNYPKLVIQGMGKELDDSLPFATLYLATITGSKLPLAKSFEIFSKFSGYGQVAREVGAVVNDVKSFGFDLNTAIERQIDRTSSKNFSELLWGVLSALRSGANLHVFLKEKAATFMGEYRRKIYEFSHSLTLYIELYLTTIVLGSIFFTILTAIIAGIGGGEQNIIFLQFLLIFLFLPVVSVVFIFLIRSITPGGE